MSATFIVCCGANQRAARRAARESNARCGRLVENLGAVAVELTAAELRQINDAASTVVVQGQRYSEAAQRMIDR